MFLPFALFFWQLVGRFWNCHSIGWRSFRKRLLTSLPCEKTIQKNWPLTFKSFENAHWKSRIEPNIYNFMSLHINHAKCKADSFDSARINVQATALALTQPAPISSLRVVSHDLAHWAALHIQSFARPSSGGCHYCFELRHHGFRFVYSTDFNCDEKQYHEMMCPSLPVW